MEGSNKVLGCCAIGIWLLVEGWGSFSTNGFWSMISGTSSGWGRGSGKLIGIGGLRGMKSETSSSTPSISPTYIRYHFIIDKIKEKCMSLQYINTEDIVADILTKPLGKTLIEKIVKLFVCNV